MKKNITTLGPISDAIRELSEEKIAKQKRANLAHEMTVTIAQAETLHKKWQTAGDRAPEKFGDFLAQVSPVFGGDGAVTVPWCGMWLCIEKDGYSYS